MPRRSHPIDPLLQIDTLEYLFNQPRPKGFYFPGESHDFWEMVYVHQGQVTATADERVYQLGSGKLLLHKPMEFHRIWSSPDCSPWIVNISFQAHGDLIPKLENSCFDLHPDQQQQFWEIVKHFDQVMAFSNSDNTHQYRLAINLTATLLEAFLIGLTENKRYSLLSQTPNDERYSKIVQVMKENCQEDLSLDQLAKHCQMSVSNMKRIFRMYSDVGVAKYFMTLKIRYAMELLDKGNSAVQVAEALHFPDAAYFYTVFKRETHMTPMQYRNRKSQP